MGERELVAVDLVNDLTLIGPYLTKAGAMLMGRYGKVTIFFLADIEVTSINQRYGIWHMTKQGRI